MINQQFRFESKNLTWIYPWEYVKDENVKLQNELEVLEWEYKKLYSKYTEMVEINKRLQDEF